MDAPKDRKLNRRQRSRLKREVPQPPILDQRERMIPESYARWIAEELHWSWSGGHEGRLTDADWAQLLTEAAAACSTK